MKSSGVLTGAPADSRQVHLTSGQKWTAANPTRLVYNITCPSYPETEIWATSLLIFTLDVR
ncbi:hypothetical protein EYZ11_002944 [Aspergillus tanneri]|uniref:Uncharacterized protein n=1 Tax=Aspergillus tanneri TaxID=1220188 RepID=A0A4S3JPI2_9EURO|nr:hypothetical protein EYZ11_002944 [Aspergillus tanneri]